MNTNLTGFKMVFKKIFAFLCFWAKAVTYNSCGLTKVALSIGSVNSRDVIVSNLFSIRYIDRLFSISIRFIDISIEMLSMP